MDKHALDHWAREALSLALYECFLSAAAALQRDIEDIQGEAAWRSPPHDQWLVWRAKRKFVNDITPKNGG
jgi:hypothetical protein